MIRLTQNDWRLFRRLQRKHKVSTEFLRYNLVNIEKFIWFETWPRIVIKRYAIRKQNRVFIIYYRLRRVLFDQSNRKIFKRMRQNIKQWSKRIVAWQKTHLGIQEYIEEVVCEDKSEETPCGTNEDVSKQLKEQLELLKNGRRQQPLITNTKKSNLTPEQKHEFIEKTRSESHEEKQKSDSNRVHDVITKLKKQLSSTKHRRDNAATLDMLRVQEPISRDTQFSECSNPETQGDWQINLESTPEKQITTQENVQPVKQLDTDEKTEKSNTEPNTQQTEKLKSGLNFLDMLMCKVNGSTISINCVNQTSSSCSNTSPSKAKETLKRMPSSSSLKEGFQHEHSMDSTDEFLGFDDCERIPGMLMTPIVPHSSKNSKNSAFVSESLNEYMRLNDLETNYCIDKDKSVTKSKIFARDMEGLMTPKTKAPHFDMPAVPENLLRFRTVAERKQYLQKFSKNSRLAIINNEASIYRELQRRMRTQKVKSASQMLAQSANSSMSFTRNGWNAASFINTEFNKYYFQILDVDNGSYIVRLKGARGNNDEFNKTAYISRVIKPSIECSEYCADDRVWQCLKPIKTIAAKTQKLNKSTLPSVFKPCPLSHKTFQKPLDDDTAALLLAGGSMAVVRMPTVELEVFPECGKSLHEIAKRYLQYILPHHDISREWAEFSVSTLQQPKSLKEAEQTAAKSLNARYQRKSYTFVIPYLNDRNHILVRRVVDRSEKLDQSFEQCLEERELVPKTDFSFRKNLDQTDDVLLTCADVVSDMINTVAISCSENSFIKADPDGFNMDEVPNSKNKISNSKKDANGSERPASSSPNTTSATEETFKKQKKQNSLLMELKRLNATIIDAAVKPENDKRPCPKEYCQMGCICVSLKENAPVREHCGKTKCMLECTCKPSNQSRIMRLETDGRTLTTEDAFMLRRKATARLARMEKEFTSTVVLTENETLLINETNNDKKRRCTKAPKRYEDFTDTEDEQRRNSPKKAALTTIDKEKHCAIEIKELHEPVYVKDSIFEQLKHCTVNLVALPAMDNIAPWCMVHHLYKCFCKGRAVEGKPMVIEKEEVNTTVEHDSQQKLDFDYNISVKAKYTFEKVEKKKIDESIERDDKDENYNDDNQVVPEHYDEEDEEDSDDGNNWIKERKRKKKDIKETKVEKHIDKRNVTNEQPKTDDESEETVGEEYASQFPTEKRHIEGQKSKRSLHDVRIRFYQPRLDSCRRHIPTPRRMFLYCNRRRRLNVLKYIKDNENDQTRLLLNEHVMRSVYYHKIDIDNHRKQHSASRAKEKQGEEEKSSCKKDQQPQAAESLPATDVANKKYLLVNEIVDLVEDEEECTSSNALNKNKDENSQLPSSTTKSCSSFEKILPDKESAENTNHFQICSSGGVITVKKFSASTDLKKTEQNNSETPASTPTNPNELSEVNSLDTDTETDGIKLPKIASCFSLNVRANVQKPPSTAQPNEEQQLDFTSATSVNSAAFAHTPNQQTTISPSPFSAGGSATSKDAGNAFVLDMDMENVKDVYNSVIKTMNSLVSKKMQDIDCALQRESHIIPTPNADILCVMKWCNFLDAFCEGFAYIWQVKVKDSIFFVVTIQNVMPLIAGAMGIVNITALKAEKMPLMGRMLLQKIRNKETERLAVVMQGKHSHWVVKGFLKADPSLACNKPTPETHPSLTKKINILCSLLVKQRQKEQKKKDKLANQWTNSQKNSATHTIIRPTQTSTQTPQVSPKIAQILPTRRTIAVQPTITPRASTPPQFLNPPQIPQPELQPPTPTPTTLQISQIVHQHDTDSVQKNPKQKDIEPGKLIAKINSRKRKVDQVQSNHLLKMDAYSKMSSNIEFRSVNQSDIDEIFLPELHKLDHKWLVLDLHNDFSHIFVPDFRDLVSLDRIQKVINFARQKSKIVKLQFFQNAPFDAFVTPKSGRKIYFGPLTMKMNAPTLILLQSVDGQMMLRELYQLTHNIVKKPEEKTKAFWLVHLKGQTHFEMEINVNNEKATVENILATSITPAGNTLTTTPEPTTAIVSEEANKNVICDNDDEDCMIIDDSEQHFNSKDIVINMIPESNPLIAPTTSKTNNIEAPILASHSYSLLKVPNTNTIIKPLNSTNTLPPVLINVPPISNTNKTLPILTLPPNTIITGIKPPPTPSSDVLAQSLAKFPTNAVITGIESAPPEAPYSSTIFITPSTPSATTSSVATTTSATNKGNTAITLNSSEINRIQCSELKSPITKQSTNIMRQALEAGAIKRRRISLFCSNKYDKISENLAVDAVIRKILPNNAEDIQINPVREESNILLNTSEVVATVGSTKISKIPHTEANTLQTSIGSTRKYEMAATSTKPQAPIVFDVNFMDDGDEPTASIVIKPNTSAETSSTANTITSKAEICKIVKLNTTTTSTSIIKGQIASTTACAATNLSSLTTIGTFTAPPFKQIKLPPTTLVTSSTNTPVVTTKGKLIGSLLCAKQPNIVQKFATHRLIAPKINDTPCSSLGSSSTDISVTSSSPSLKKTPVSLRVQRVVTSTAVPLQVVKSITTTATVATSQLQSTPTLTVKQVQDMLKKPCLNTTAINPTTSSSGSSPSLTLPLQILPAIKATITPAKITPIPATSTIATTPATSTSLSSQGLVPSTSIAKSISSSTLDSNSTLTISKVQSFGSVQKPHNPDINMQPIVPSPAPIVINDVNNTVPIPSPPAHIQYGYIVSAAYINQKFVAKRVAEEFYVKVPSVGILKLQGLPAVNNYLNKYISKIIKETQATAAVWQFVAASKAVQMQNHQKSLLVRKTKNNTGTPKTNTLDEPILIDD